MMNFDAALPLLDAEIAAARSAADEARRRVKALEKLRVLLVRPTAEDEWISTAQAAALFGVPDDTVRSLARRKEMGKKIGGRWLISRSALRSYRTARITISR